MTDWRAEYERRYRLAKERGRSFFPYAVFKDAVVWLLLFVALCWLAHQRGAPLEDLADPTDTTYNPRPEWYFLFLFQSLKAFPGRLESVAAVVLPTVTLLILATVPFLDRGPKRHPLDRPFWTALGATAAAGFVTLTIFGARTPLLNPGERGNPEISKGRRLYSDLNCAYCHSIRGKGGGIGPSLDSIDEVKPMRWIDAHCGSPASARGRTIINLLPDELDALTAYLQSVGTGGPYTTEATQLFAANCEACHSIHGRGGGVGPDLSLIGGARDRGYIKNYIRDSSKIRPDSVMPSFKGQLTDVQIEDLTRYLAHLR